MIAGYARRRDHEKDLLAWHALRTTEYKEGTLPAALLGREPLPLDPRWQDPDESLTDAELEQLAEDDAEARLGTFRAAGYPTGRVSPEEYAQMVREATGR